ncbi:MAG: ROK family protein [bacterium]
MREPIYLGIDLGGTKIAAGLVTRAGELRSLARVATPARQGVEAVVAAAWEVTKLAARGAQVAVGRITGVGVGAPGPIDRTAGVVVAPPNLPGWKDVDLRSLMERRLRAPVHLENDANAAGLAEVRFGAGRGCSPVIYLTVSTGIGGALLVDGRLITGAAGAAGEAGHLVVLPDGPSCGCGGRGCLEALASGTAVARRAREAVRRGAASALTERFGSRPGRITARTVAKLADQGDPEAQRIVTQAMEYLGIGVANLVNLINPERVVIGGGLTALGPRMFDPVRRAVRRHCNPVAVRAVTIEPAALGADSGVIGAATLAMD